jgi:hypothetical protein
MVFRPTVLMAETIVATPALRTRYGEIAKRYLDLSEAMFAKWDKRGAWRRVDADDAAITVILPFGIDQDAPSKWVGDYQLENRNSGGTSHPDNKANLVASWLLAMFDATGKPIYKDRAAQWFRLMKARMKLPSLRPGQLWNYWEPAGAWDYRGFVIPKHWVGVHPNMGYYAIDVDCVVDAYEHGVVFDKTDLERLVDISVADGRYWPSLARYSDIIKQRVLETNKAGDWSGLAITPWYLTLQAGKPEADLVP